jgi:hypothetical protein
MEHMVASTPQAPDVLALAKQAARCRRLARDIYDEATTAKLLALAAEYEARSEAAKVHRFR